tara:strand:- start:88485 stop:89672 length:1188 start_codon:yes stop_codon:yes gene_type:complete
MESCSYYESRIFLFQKLSRTLNMPETSTYDLIILGGGLAGLCCAIALGQHYKVLLLEKDLFPQHKVCGEYVSNEVLPYLQSLGIDPIQLGAKKITELEITTHTGKPIRTKLPLGGFGISRYALDAELYNRATQCCDVHIETVMTVDFNSEIFTVQTKNKKIYKSTYAVGAFGKRSTIDVAMKRGFIQQKSPWLAVKAHYSYSFEDTKVALHNFEGGYCGLSKVETGAVNACYLTTFKSFKQANSIDEFQKQVMSVNPHLAHFFKHAEPLFPEPLTISQISFSKKPAVENHVFMIGDSAGLIHPLCGNGMAMAIHSAKLLADLFLEHGAGVNARNSIEQAYRDTWQHHFGSRLKTGRRIQNVLLNPSLAKTAFTAAKTFPGLVPAIIKKTHGDLVV